MKKLTRLATLFMAAALLAIGLAFAACGDGGSEEVSNVSEDEHTEAAAHEEGETQGGERLIRIVTKDLKFEPDTIEVKVGETVRITLDNEDPFLHDYSVDEPEFIILEASGAQHDHGEAAVAHEDGDEQEAGTHEDDHDRDAQVSMQPLHIAAEGNEHADLVFQATEPGEYEFYCSVPGHREAGMVGKIIIKE